MIRALLCLAIILLPLRGFAEQIKVGALLSLSGDYAALGSEISKGIELAQTERGESTPKIEILTEDIQTLNNKVAVAAAQKLLSQGIDVAVSSYASESEPLAPLFQAKGLPLMVLWDSTEQLLNTGDMIFSNGFSTEGAGKRAADLAHSNLKLSKVAIISHIDGWSTTFANSFAARFQELGGSVLSHQELGSDVSDFRTPIVKAKSQNPEGLIFPLVAYPSSFLKQARAAQVSVPLVSGDTMIIPGEIEAAGPAAEGVYFTAIYTDKEAKIQSLYKAKYGQPSEDPVSVSFGYDGMQTIYRAISLMKQNAIPLPQALSKVLGPNRSASRITALYRIHQGRIERLG